MRLAKHRMPEETFLALARGRGGAAAVRQLAAARRSRNLMMLRTMVIGADAGKHPEAGAARSAYRSLTAIEQWAPAAVAAVVDYPSVGAWVLRTVMQLRAGESAARPGFLAAVAAAAALRSGISYDIDLSPARRPGAGIALPSLGTANFPDGDTGPVTLRCRAAGAALIGSKAAVHLPLDLRQTDDGWRGLPQICADAAGQRLEVLLDVLDPDEGIGPAEAEDLTDPHVVDRWRSRVTEGWRHLVRHHQQTAAEFVAAVTVLAPLTVSADSFVSATPSNAFGCITMSYPQDALTVALTFAHELQHVKLAALTDLFSLVEIGSDERFYVPWRNEPRPALGLLHGTYAHLGVAGFWRRLRNAGFDHLRVHIEFARWRAAAYDVARFLVLSGRLTPLGRIFVQGMLSTLEQWIRERVPTQAAAVAQRLSAEHRSAWSAVYGDPGSGPWRSAE